MNTVILTILILSFLNNVSSISSICCSRFKNNNLKLILLRDKRNIKIFKECKNFYKFYYDKSMLSIVHGVSSYNTLTDDEKTIIETIISLCY
jgi:hypothetical protein